MVTEREATRLRGDLCKGLAPPQLGLNCVGGRNATTLVRALSREGATLVTYGGMSKQGVTVPTGSLIFHGITLKGFWMTAWNEVSLLCVRPCL